MATANDPFGQFLLHPFSEPWSAGPGASVRVVRFGLWVGVQARAESPDEAPDFRRILQALVVTEMPLSVLPYQVREANRVVIDDPIPLPWQGRPVPLWRGVPCRLGTMLLRLRSALGQPPSVDLQALALLPVRDPAGPPVNALLLGSRFFVHYGLRVVLDYPAVRYRPDATAPAPIDSRSPCGHLELA